MKTAKVTDLRVGDKINLFEGAYGWATVTKVEVDIETGSMMREVTVNRVYAVLTESGSLHTGIEEVMLFGDSKVEYPLERNRD